MNVANGNITISTTNTTSSQYTGSRSNQATLNAYKALVTNPSNWTTLTSSALTTLNTTSFTTSAPTPTVNLSVSTNTSSEAAATVVTVTATASAAVTGNQTVTLAVSGTNITAGDYTLSNTTITIPNGGTTGTVTFTIVDDAVVESTETAVLTISAPSAGISLGSTTTQNITITDNDAPPPPIVNLSVSTNAGSEENKNTITITATASAAVVGDQTVTLNIAGSGITVHDYFGGATTIVIPETFTTGSTTITIRNDAELEGNETLALTISNPSAGIQLGSTVTQNVVIADNTCQPLIRKATQVSTNGAEISAFDSASKRLYTVAGTAIEYYTMSNAGVLSAPTNVPFGFTSFGNTILPNSVAIKNGIVAISYAIVDVNNAQQLGKVAFYTASTGAYISDVTVGYLPDMVIFTPDGTKLLTANEGEPNSYGQGTSFDPEGSVSIIDIASGVASATVQTAGFTSFNSQIASLRAAGVRIYGPGATVAQDLEPEYITFSANGSKAIVTLQENNAIAEVDIATATVTNIYPLGYKNHNTAGNGFDASDQDGPSINIQNWKVLGMYQPDAISSFVVGGTQYYITANEGDSRALTGFNEEARVSTLTLDATAYPTASTLKLAANLGRLQLTNATGDTDGDGDIDQLYALGARSFSIWNSTFTQIYDSGDKLEQITATENPRGFNGDPSAPNTPLFDTRSDNKGPEPEGVVTGIIDGVLYAFVGSERTGDILVYDISNPPAPVFKQYIDHPDDRQVEGLLLIPAIQSPTGKALIVVSAELSKTVTVYEFSLVNNTLATTTTIVNATQSTTTTFGNCTSLVAKVNQITTDPNTITGTVTSTVWIEPTVPTSAGKPYVQRHYEITPASNAATATGIVTLYFTQTEFDNFNADPASTLDLPTGPSDVVGIDNLQIIKYSGTSNNGTGLPATYTSTPTPINPANADIVWNSTFNRWEISFTTNGFSGFFVQTDLSILAVNWLTITGKLSTTNQAILNWKVQENNVIKYSIEKSTNANNYTEIGGVNSAGNGTNNYSYTDNQPITGTTYYRIKQTDLNGKISYSSIVKLSINKTKIATVYPNPTAEIITLQVSNNYINTKATLYNSFGHLINTISVTNNSTTINVTTLLPGVYWFKLKDGTTLKFVKE